MDWEGEGRGAFTWMKLAPDILDSRKLVKLSDIFTSFAEKRDDSTRFFEGLISHLQGTLLVSDIAVMN
jgi:hypothetical protein